MFFCRSLFILISFWMPFEVSAFTSLASDPVACEEPSILEQFNNNCFNEREGGMGNRRGSTFITSAMQLQSDQEVCACLKSRIASRTLMTALAFNTPSEERINNRLRLASIDRVNNISQAYANASFVQATIVATSETSALEITRPFTGERIWENASITAELQAANSRIGSSPEHNISLTGPDNNLLNEVNGKQCVSLREFLNFNMLPSENKFFLDLKKDLAASSQYKDDEWNYTKLRKKLEDFGFNSLENIMANKEAAKVYHRMDFLQRNPLLKNIFSLEPTAENRELVQTKKSQLHTLMSNSFKAGLANCKDAKDVYCNNIIIKNGGFDTFKSSLSDFLTNPENAPLNQLVADHTSRDLASLLNLTSRMIASESVPPNRRALEFAASSDENSNSVERANCTRRNIGDSNLSLDGWAERHSRCVSEFARYCPVIENRNVASDNLLMNLEENWLNRFNANPLENGAFNYFKRQTCDTPRKNNQNPSAPHLTFWQFRDQSCPAGNNKPECSEASLTSLRSSYLSSYSPVENDSLDQTSRADAMVADRLLQRSNSGPVTFDNKTKNTLERSITYRSDGTPFDPNLEKKMTVTGKTNRTADQAVAAKRAAFEEAEARSSAQPIVQPVSESVITPMPIAQIAPVAAAATFIPNSDRALAEARRQTTEIENVRNDIQEDIQNVRSQMVSSNNNEDRRRLEERINSMEMLLAQKDREAQANSQLVERILQQNERLASGDVSRRPANHSQNNSADEEINSINNNESPLAPVENNLLRPMGHVADRSQASVPQAASAGSIGRNSGGAQAVSSERFNTALLSKYGITVNGPSDGNLFVNPESDSANLTRLESAHTTAGGNLPLNVSEEVFRGFESRDAETLRRYESMITSLNTSVVRISVTTSGRDQPLELYAIKESGRIVFQPVRRVHRENLVDLLRPAE